MIQFSIANCEARTEEGWTHVLRIRTRPDNRDNNTVHAARADGSVEQRSFAGGPEYCLKVLCPFCGNYSHDFLRCLVNVGVLDFSKCVKRDRLK